MQEIVGAIIEASRCVGNFTLSLLSTLRKFRKNIQTLKYEQQKLSRCKYGKIEEVNLSRLEGKHPPWQVMDWLERVEKIEREVEGIEHESRLLLEADPVDAPCGLGCMLDSNMRRKYQLSKAAAKKRDEVRKLTEESCNLPPMEDRKPSDIAVEHILAPSLVGQKAPEILKQLMELLAVKEITRISVYGMGGSGKTTLVKTLNNQLESCGRELFDMVIWVPVSNDLDMKKVQSRIAERLNLALNAEESTERRASKLQQVLKSGKRFLFILDDVWEKIDLHSVGIPQGDGQANCKIVLTTRNLDVCREMMTDKALKMELLTDEESWTLFAQNAGNVVELEDINPLAKEIARECGGLPLAIETMGKSMRDKTMIQLWRNALCQLKLSEPHFGSLDKVYLRLQLSYNALPSKIYKSCFLSCSLFPENFSIQIRELILLWLSDGIIGERQTLEESINDGHAKLEYLKDCCMLEQGEGIGTVKMHSILREVAIWISSNEKETGFFSSPVQGMLKLKKSVRRASFMSNSIKSLPAQLLGGSDLTVLFLHCNPLNRIPDGFFQEHRVLRFLNLSSTLITSLPSSILQLRELHTLLLRDCHALELLPPLGALYKLQVLDLYGTRIRKLPKDMGKLIHLRDLNLSHTRFLQVIAYGSMLGLISLEVLDMSFSGYKWDVKRNAGRGAAFDELLSLRRLSVVHIRLNTVDCVALDSACPWFGRLKEYTIQIGPNSIYLPTQHEKRVILRGVDLLQRGLEGLLYTASALDLFTCGGISSLSDIITNKSVCGLPNLKSLTISNCDCITTLLVGETTLRSTLPNLEHLTLSHLDNLATLLDNIVPRRSLGNLKTIKVEGCRLLKNLISFSLLRLVSNLEEIKVSHCRRMKQVIAKDFYEKIPKLRTIEVRDMESLSTICSRGAELSALERIVVSNCPRVVKLPFTARDALTIKEIRGDLNWWTGLKWQNREDKISLQQRFQACADTAVPPMED
ncbi:hypothetical protein ACFX2K_007535 [Malus domestica]